MVPSSASPSSFLVANSPVLHLRRDEDRRHSSDSRTVAHPQGVTDVHRHLYIAENDTVPRRRLRRGEHHRPGGTIPPQEGTTRHREDTIHLPEDMEGDQGQETGIEITITLIVPAPIQGRGRGRPDPEHALFRRGRGVERRPAGLDVIEHRHLEVDDGGGVQAIRATRVVAAAEVEVADVMDVGEKDAGILLITISCA